MVGYKDVKESEVIPKYLLKGNLSGRIITKLINQILDEVVTTDNLSKGILNRYKTISLDRAIREIYFPKGKGGLDRAIIKLKF